MKQRSIFALFALAFAIVLVLSVQARVEPEPTRFATVVSTDPLTGAVLVDLDDDATDADRAEVASRIVRAVAPYGWPAGDGALGVEIEDEANLYRLTPPASEIADIIAALRGHEDVEVVEAERRWSIPDWREHVAVRRGPVAADAPDTFVPNDPYYGYQWHLDQIGMPEAWTHQRGEGVIVAVIDTGVAYRDEGGFARAPDLANTNIVPGWDFIDGDAFPDDEHGHGTHVAGTIAQSTNNGVGVAGVAPGASIMPLKVLDANGSGGWGGIAAAIRWAADNGAHVINMSLGGGFPSRSVQRAIDHAHSRGVLVVAAAGNASRDRVEYPARHDHVLSVGAVRYDRTLSFYSSYGEGLDVVAPGGDLRVDQNEDGMPDGVVQNTIVGGNPGRFDYLAWQGTSMAAPHVAGAAALLYGSGIRDPDTVEHMLAQSADDLGDVQRYGSGLIQAHHALRLAEQGTAGARGAAALGFVLLMLLGLRRRNEAGGVSGVRSAAWSVALAGGLGLLPWFLIPQLGAWIGAPLSAGLFGGLASAAGPLAAPLVLSALPIFIAVIFTLHIERMRPVLVGLGVGGAAFFAVEALWPTMNIGLLPELAIGPWLLVNALLAVGLSFLVARKAR